MRDFGDLPFALGKRHHAFFDFEIAKNRQQDREMGRMK
jgi:hypothetical protein